MHTNSQSADMTTKSALAAPKLDVVGKRDEMHTPAAVLDMASQNALEYERVFLLFQLFFHRAPKLEVQGGIQKSESKHQFDGLSGITGI